MKRWLHLVFLGCGGSISTPDALATTDSGATPPNPLPAAVDAGSAGPEAGAPMCLETPPTSDDCKVSFEPCAGCAVGREYFCKGGAPRTYARTPMHCTRLEDVGGSPHYCCEAACVRRTSTDDSCAGAPRGRSKAYECPNDGANGSLVGPPSGACTAVVPDVSPTHPRIFCCDS